MLLTPPNPDFAGLAARLSGAAARLATARAESSRLGAAGRFAARWRKAALLWPLFTKG